MRLRLPALPAMVILGIGLWLGLAVLAGGLAHPAPGPPAAPAAPIALAAPTPVAIVGYDAEGHPFELATRRGQVVAIVLLSRYTRKPAAPVQDALSRLVQPGQVEVISVVDMIGIPGIFRGMAKRKVLAGSRGSVMRFLVDDHGTWRAYFGAQPDRQVDILVLDRAGVVRGHFVGPESLPQAQQLIRRLQSDER